MSKKVIIVIVALILIIAIIIGVAFSLTTDSTKIESPKFSEFRNSWYPYGATFNSKKSALGKSKKS